MVSSLKRVLRIAAVYTVAVLASEGHADAAAATQSSTFWNLQPRDTFLVDVLIERTTNVVPLAAANQTNPGQSRSGELPQANRGRAVLSQAQPGGLVPQETVIRDRLNLEYRVESVTPTGHLQVSVAIRGAVRLANAAGDDAALPALERQLELLRGIEVLLEVDPQGHVAGIGEADRLAMIGALSGFHPEGEAVLQECCSSAQLSAWFAKPFWFDRPSTSAGARPSAQPEPAAPDQASDSDTESGTAAELKSRDVRDLISLGTLGALHTTVRLGSAQDSSSKDGNSGGLIPLKLNGHARYVPFRATPGFQPGITAGTVDLVRYSGTALVAASSPAELQSSRLRPAFQRLDLTFEVRGTCNLQVGRETVALEFQQVQSQTWVLRASQMRRNFLDQSNRLVLPEVPLP